MDAGSRYLFLNYIREVVVVSLLIIFMNFVPPLLFVYVFNLSKHYWFATVIWIFTVQIFYMNFIAFRAYTKRRNTYNDLMQAVRDAIDVQNTEKSLIKEKQIGPN